MKIIEKIKDMSTWDKALVVGLFIIPIPLTMEAYFGLKGLKKVKNLVKK